MKAVPPVCLTAVAPRGLLRRLGEEHPLASPLGVVDHEAASDPPLYDFKPLYAGIRNLVFWVPLSSCDDFVLLSKPRRVMYVNCSS